MDFVILDKTGKEKGYLPAGSEMDFEIGTDKSDMQLVVEPKVIEHGDFVVCYGTGYGAVMEESVIRSDTHTETWYGYGFRKLLDQIIIEPDQGQDYRVVSGDPNAILRSLLSTKLGGFFSIPDTDAGAQVKAYQFARYCTALTGLTAMLDTISYKLSIVIEEPFKVVLSAVPVVRYTPESDFSEDTASVTISIDEDGRGINHLICLGKGDLKDRQVIHLYAWPDGSAKTEAYYTGFKERTATYDYSSVESLDELKKQGAQKLTELMSKTSVTLTVSGADLEIGDMVTARLYKSDRYAQATITGKIIKIEKDGRVSIDYRTGGE